MKTMLDTPEMDRQEFGVIWDMAQDEPYSEYHTLDEAKQVAKATHGYIVFRKVSDWVPLPAHALA